tara:strand:+ start:6340 stop:6894 length:555 start_codon:yes stop_codon:yes gene_type:complete
MNLTITNHLIEATEYLPSPNHNDRPTNTAINLLVIHNISLPPGEFAGDAVKQLFMNQLDASAHPYFAKIANNPVSAHAFIQRDGRITQFVPFDKRAWHAGQSSFKGQENCNDYSIGIEVEGADDIPYTTEQYASLISLTKAIMAVYPDIKSDRIVGHCDIAPERKTDPGPSFDWTFYLHELETA